MTSHRYPHFGLMVEGHGETKSANVLLGKVMNYHGLPAFFHPALRWKHLDRLEAPTQGLRKAGEYWRNRNVQGLLVLFDVDERCPATLIPELAGQLRESKLPFPVAIVAFKPEYEVLFLPCIADMPPSLGLGSAAWTMDSWEARRGVKEWLTRQMPQGVAYKPSVHQETMTRHLNLCRLQTAEVPCFGTLLRATHWLHSNAGASGCVYPAPQE